MDVGGVPPWGRAGSDLTEIVPRAPSPLAFVPSRRPLLFPLMSTLQPPATLFESPTAPRSGELPGELPGARVVSPADARLAARLESAGRARAWEAVPLALPTTSLLGIDLHAVSQPQAVETVLAELEAGRGGTILTLNLNRLHRCRGDVTYRALVAEADLAVADGMPLVLASKLQSAPLPGRVTGASLLSGLSAGAEAAGRKVFLLGGDPGVAAAAAGLLRRNYPQLEVAGTHCPGRDLEYDTIEIARILKALGEAQPDIVFVALGTPREEKLINQLRRNLPRAWWAGVGVSFSYLTGHVRRAPTWMQRVGLEWAHRLGQEPRRRFREYVIVGMPFAARLMAGAAVTGLSTRVLGRPLRSGYARRRTFSQLAAAARRFDGQVRAVSDSNERAVATAADELARTDRTGSSASSASPAAGPVVRVRERLANVPPARTAQPPVAPAHESPVEASEVPAVLSRLKAMILLAGRVRPSPFTAGTRRPILELPLAERETPDGRVHERLMDGWLRWGGDVAALAGHANGHLPTRVIVSDAKDAPHREAAPGGPARPAGSFGVDLDFSEYRGTGGLLRDFAAEYDDDDLLLVCNAQQILVDPIAALVRALGQRMARGADVALVAHDDGTPSGMMIVRCGAMRVINAVGYNDMKEQGLPMIAAEHDVRVVRCRRPTGLPVRTAAEYVQALCRYHAQLAGRGRGSEPHPLSMPFAEDNPSRFALVEPGAEVHPAAYLHDSVVLSGARVEAGATVVRSILCEGVVVRRDGRAVDETIGRSRA